MEQIVSKHPGNQQNGTQKFLKSGIFMKIVMPDNIKFVHTQISFEDSINLWTKLPNVWWIINGSNNIFNIEVNGALPIHVIMHNSLINAKSRIVQNFGFKILILTGDIKRWCSNQGIDL